MKENYYSNYFQSISKGLLDSSYFVDQKEIQADFFFKEINDFICNLRSNNNRIYFFGNGASAAFANHMALDFSKNGNIVSRSLSDSAYFSALSNDYSFEMAFVEFLKIERITSKDLVVTISSSGNSTNIVNILNYCEEHKITSLSLSGLKSDNKSILKSRYSVYVPMKTYGMVECIHQIFLHLFLDRSMNITEWGRDDFQNMNSLEFNL